MEYLGYINDDNLDPRFKDYIIKRFKLEACKPMFRTFKGDDQMIQAYENPNLRIALHVTAAYSLGLPIPGSEFYAFWYPDGFDYADFLKTLIQEFEIV